MGPNWDLGFPQSEGEREGRMKWRRAHGKAGKASHCLGKMAAGGEEERKGWESHPVLLFKHGFMTHCPPPEAAHSATNSWVASSRQLEDCCSSLPRKSLLGPWSGGGELEGWSSAPGLVRGGGAVGDQHSPSWTCPVTRCHAHLRTPVT